MGVKRARPAATTPDASTAGDADTATDPAGLTMVAARSFKFHGQNLRRGDTFDADTPAQAALLTRSGHATAVTPDTAAAVGRHHELATSHRARQLAKGPRKIPPLRFEPPAPDAPRVDDRRTLEAIAVVPLRDALELTEARLRALEATVAELAGAPVDDGPTE